jgi:hypothetical protein
MTVEAFVLSPTQGRICFKVDGVMVTCPSADMSTNAGVVSTTNVAYPVAPGPRTVQAFINAFNANGYFHVSTHL